MVHQELRSQAKEKEINIHKLLREKASKLKVGERRLLALDWFNGNRSILVNANLTGVILGLTLRTKSDLKAYKPNQGNQKAYSTLYAEYKKLHDCFGRGINRVMKII